MTEYAQPEDYFAISLNMAAVRQEDYDAVTDALVSVRNRFCRGGSTIGVESVGENTVINR